MFRAPCAHHHEIKIVLYRLWYHHTETSEWSKITKMQFYKYQHIVAITPEKFTHKFYYYGVVSVCRLKPAYGYHTTPAKPQRNTNTHRNRAIQPMK